MRKLTPRETVLLVVVIGVGILGWIYGRGGTLGGGGRSGEDLGELNFGPPPVVQLAHLEREPIAYDPNARNLFAYYTPPAPVVRRPPPPRVEARPAPPPVVQRPPVQPPVARREPAPPSPGFRYIGFLGPKDNKIAVLERGDEILLAAIGEPVDKQFKVVGFGYEKLVLGYTSERWADKTTDLPMKR